jgi:hypothetical protein
VQHLEIRAKNLTYSGGGFCGFAYFVTRLGGITRFRW